MNYQLLTDSCCDLPLEFIEEHEIDVVNFIVNIDGEEQVDDMGVTFDKEEFFQRLRNGATASTSQVNIQTYLSRFREYIEEGLPVLYLGFSSGLSGSLNNAKQALQMLKEEYDDPKVTIIDTQAACLGQGMLVYEAVRRKEAGASLEEVASWVEKNKGKLHSWVTVDDIKHLQRGGRVSAAQATLGSLLKVKPIIVMTKNGKLVLEGKVRGRRKSLQKLIDETVEGIVQPEEQTLFVGHVGVPEEAEFVREKLMTELSVKDVLVSTYGPTIAAHTGFGSIAVFSFGKERTIEKE